MNAEWAAFASQEALKNKLSRVIPVLVGNSNKAIGLALAVAENAVTGRTLIVKDGEKGREEFVLHDLDASFVKNVKHLSKAAPQGSPLHSVHSHPMYKCLISALKLLVESNVAAKETRHSAESGFTVTIFADDDSSGIFNDDVSFGEVLNEASLLYREFGYGVPNVVLWAMSSTVCHENHINSDNNYNNCSTHEPVAYSSVSCDGALTIRVGCDTSDICAYLGVENKRGNWKHNHTNDRANDRANDRTNDRTNEWHNDWNHLVEMLYNQRYYQFEQYFWKN
jgi:hypothetical protein